MLFMFSGAIYVGYNFAYDNFAESKAAFTVGLNYQSVQFYGFVMLFGGITLIVDLTRRTIVEYVLHATCCSVKTVEKLEDGGEEGGSNL